MIAARRRAFNRRFTDAGYAAFLNALEARLGVPVEFRVSETPWFLPASLASRCVREGQAMVRALLDDPAYRAAADEAVPARFRLPGGEDRPTFVQVDVGLVATGDGFEGRLVELQAFPSLYGFQAELAAVYMEHWGLDGVTPFLGGLDRAAYLETMRHVIVGRHDPAEVVLMEIDPVRQKTRPDFAATEKLWGVRAVDVREVRRDGRRLVYDRDGVRTPIARIYNRVIPDELERKGLELPFDYRDDLDVEWAGGPDWFFRLSKFSIPWLRHPWVPQTSYLSDLDTLPPDRERWLLKPLYSFAGGGIVFAPTDGQIARIPADERRHYILQERVAFTPVIESPHGPTQAELRLMFVRDGDAYRPVMPLVRLGRGLMMGVDHNKGLTWVGASAGLIDPAE